MTLKRPKAILFDMDGTLTTPMLDFPRIKRDMGLAPDQPILEALALLPPDDRARAQAILDRHEADAATNSTLNPGCLDLLGWLSGRDIPAALITRNSRRNVDIVCSRHGLSFHLLLTRDTGLFKPDPAPLLLACEHLGVRPADAWMVGDGSHDVAAGNAASIPTVWISHDRPRPFPDEPTLTLPDLPSLLAVLRSPG